MLLKWKAKSFVDLNIDVFKEMFFIYSQYQFLYENWHLCLKTLILLKLIHYIASNRSKQERITNIFDKEFIIFLFLFLWMAISISEVLIRNQKGVMFWLYWKTRQGSAVYEWNDIVAKTSPSNLLSKRI